MPTLLYTNDNKQVPAQLPSVAGSLAGKTRQIASLQLHRQAKPHKQKTAPVLKPGLQCIVKNHNFFRGRYFLYRGSW
jgi:hypothetical protein